MARPAARMMGAWAFVGLTAALGGGAIGHGQAASREPAGPPALFAEPGVSPDGRAIAFASGGDIWTVEATGGEARLIVSHPATESRPLYSPDGRRLAFVSSRTGGGDIYVLDLAAGRLTRLTFDAGDDRLDAWSRDGRWIYFSSTSGDIAGMNDIYRIPSTGGTPMPVTADRYVNEFFGAPSPDGASLAFSARGMGSSQWWRNGRSHIDESEIWVWREGATPAYRRIVEAGAKQLWPMWSSDGRGLFFVSDRSGAQNIWTVPLDGQPRQVTGFKDGRVLWPSISGDGRLVAFERDSRIWTLDTSSGRVAALEITRRGVAAGPLVDRVSLGAQIQEFALSPDGKKVVMAARGELFAVSAKDGGEAFRVTATPEPETQPAWAPDSRRIAYASTREGVQRLYLYDFGARSETRLTSSGADDAWPVFSPDGKRLAFQRAGRELRVIDLDARQERLLATGYLADKLDSGRPLAWSPDGRWIAFISTGIKAFSNIVVVASDGGEARPVSFLANTFGNSLAWSPDGTAILFDTNQRTESGQVARVDLVARTPKFREDLFGELFENRAPAPKPADTVAPAKAEKPSAKEAVAPGETGPEKPAGKPVAIAFDEIRRRLSLLPVGLDVSHVSMSPDGKLLLLVGNAEGQSNLYTWPLDELSRERPVARQITSTPGGKQDPQFTPDGKEVYYLEGGRIQVVALDRREPRPLGVTADIDVDFSADRLQVFEQAWAYMRDSFYDASFHGVDWQKVHATYAPLAASAATPDELRRVLSLMVGELNASHLGVSAPQGAAPVPVGRLGLRFDRRACEETGRLRITEVVPLGPAAVSGAVKIGDVVTAIDGAGIGPGVNLDALLEHKVGRRVVVGLAPGDAAGPAREVAVMPVNAQTEKGLLYRDWVEANRRYVERASGGRLGYVHMIDMGAGSLAQLFVDLDADNHARDGVVVDVRNNNGGFVNAYALDVLARKPYLRMTLRGTPEAPSRTVLGQRALEAPTVLVTNQHSLSDAEDFTEGYRALGLGRVVGEPTAGWIIYTWSVRLLDGSSFRLPRTRVTTSDGTTMERRPRPVDVAVTRPIGEGLGGRDSQLDAAIKDLLARLPAARPGKGAGAGGGNDSHPARESDAGRRHDDGA